MQDQKKPKSKPKNSTVQTIEKLKDSLVMAEQNQDKRAASNIRKLIQFFEKRL